jgi:release factor glutamine methyltransferase
VPARPTIDAPAVAPLLAEARQRLAGQPAAALEADLLLAVVLDKDRAWLFAHPGAAVTAEQAARFQALLERRAHGEPIAYLLGRREFWSLSLLVTPDVLIPRPETELLVQSVLDYVPADAAWRVADLGTGSGAVALAIACERPRCEVHATEVDPAALQIAARNVESLAAGRVRLHAGSWLEPLVGRFRVIVSNPPYVATGDPHLAEGDCRFEPRVALTAGPDGLAAIRRIVRDALPVLEPGGLLALEHGFDQGAAVRALLKELGYRKIRRLKDLAGKDRVTTGQIEHS